MNAASPFCDSVVRPSAVYQSLGGAALFWLLTASTPAVADLIPKQNPMQGRGILLVAPGPTTSARGHDGPKQNPGQGRSVPPAPPAPVAVTAVAPVAPVVAAVVPVAPVVVSTPVEVVVPVPVATAPRAPLPTAVQGGGGGGHPVQGAAAGSLATSMALQPVNTPVPVGEVLPRPEVLVSSMKGLALPDDRADAQQLATMAAPAPACVTVTLSPDDRRSNSTLVDLTGDGLIVTPVETAHLRQVLARAGLSAQTEEAGRHCLPQAVVRDFIKPGALAQTSRPMALVQTRSGWRLATAGELSAQAKPKRKTTNVARTKASTGSAAVRPVALLQPVTAR